MSLCKIGDLPQLVQDHGEVLHTEEMLTLSKSRRTTHLITIKLYRYKHGLYCIKLRDGKFKAMHALGKMTRPYDMTNRRKKQ